MDQKIISILIYSGGFFLAYINSLTWKSMNIAEMLSHLSVIPLNPTHNSSDETRRAPYGIGTAGIKKTMGKNYDNTNNYSDYI